MSNKWTEESIEVMLSMYTEFTYEEIAEVLQDSFGIHKSANAVRKAYERHRYPIVSIPKSNRPKILVLDIETKPLEGYIWSIWQEGVGLNMLKGEWSVLSWAAKWVGEDKIYYEDQRNSKNLENDKPILKNVWKLLDEADIVLTQNGVRFDIPKLNARFIMSGMKPPSQFRQIDTLKLAKKHFKFTSNKLEWLTDNLCTKKKKLKHAKFPGFALWKECMNGNQEAWEEMKVYNIADIESLEELYFVLAPWDSTMNFSVYNDGDEDVCSCGNTKFKESGVYSTNASQFQKYKCTSCGREVRDKVNLLSKEKRKGMKTGVVR